ncbi:hypothetical conserved protein (plasmid) [Rhizobium etli CFN 42]|uniref:Hypothetical conserved protein n=1 Tax=Rhizobium etli (strain ATCC 51251 / DSM 11541 / JCM 21823 / NBRC 15573 / CFN 42) TaxID=347834 RepID=Q2JZE1_RHIEC|nr:hypothetical conserved protein [Rhizobium etli CFN 42]
MEVLVKEPGEQFCDYLLAPDHGARLSGCGGFAAPRHQPAFALRMEKEVCCVERQGNDEAEEIRWLKKELARVTEERDVPKKRPRISPGMQSEVRVHCLSSLVS